jgi:hypothetical protein
MEAVNVATQNFSSPRRGGRKPADESRADELPERLLKWSYFPASARPSLRVLAKALQTSHQLLTHLLVGLGEWEREKYLVRYRNIMKRHGRVLTEADEKRLLLKVRRWRSQCARTWAKDGPESAALSQRFRTLALAKFGPVRCEEWGLLKQKDPMAIWTDPPQGQDIWHILRTE